MPALAQNESGIRHLNKDGFVKMGYWYDETRLMFQVRYPIIKSVPPINTTMPCEVVRSYLYLDSIARFDVGNGFWRNVERGGVANDELRSLVKTFYEISDYDPTLFVQYLDEVTLSLGNGYRSDIYKLYSSIKRTLLRTASDKQTSAALYSLFYPEYILRVKVDRIDSMRIIGSEKYRYRATAQIGDVLKGNVRPYCEFDAQQSKREGREGLGNELCIQFQYTKDNYFAPDYDGEAWIYSSRETAFATDDGSFRMMPGQEAVVFLSHYLSLVDSTADYYNINLEPQASFNALPVVNGNIRDVNRVWSEDEFVSYDAWRERFLLLRNKILTGSY